MDKLNWEQVRQMLLFVADVIIKNKPYLTEVDSKIGDGDHGIGMAIGMKKAQEKLEGLTSGENVFQLFEIMGKTMMMSMGGASGIIFGTMFMGGAKGREKVESLDCNGITEWASESLLQIQMRGKAKVGDKTMVDALAPAVDAAKQYSGENMCEMLAEMEKAAQQGMEVTKQFQAKFGRARSLMERSIGHQDAGATSTWLIFHAMLMYVKGLESEKYEKEDNKSTI